MFAGCPVCVAAAGKHSGNGCHNPGSMYICTPANKSQAGKTRLELLVHTVFP